MNKIIHSIIIAAFCILLTFIPVKSYAHANEPLATSSDANSEITENEVSPTGVFIVGLLCTASNSFSEFYCNIGYSAIDSVIRSDFKIELQKKVGNSFNTIYTWYKTTTMTDIATGVTRNINDLGIYRFKITAKASDSYGNSETAIIYSELIFY